MQEFKVGDNVRMRGDDTAWNGITQDAMANATLIEPERHPRYDWSNIPPEHDWAATDRGGTVCAYKNKPVHDAVRDYWYDGKGPAKHIRHGSVTADWRDSLEQRPEVVEVHVDNKGLDLSKPVRRKNSEMEVRVIGTMSDGRIVCEYPLFGVPQYAAYYDRELENIPTPKKTTSDVLSLWEFKSGARQLHRRRRVVD